MYPDTRFRREFRQHFDGYTEDSRTKNIILGMIGGAVGTLAMDYARRRIQPLLSGDDEDQQAENGSGRSRALDDIAVAGQRHGEEESSTHALGRIGYETMTGHPPAKETKDTLSSGIHWSYGVLQGGVYGALRGNADAPDWEGGIAFGAGLWLLGDEVVVPILGLQDGPTAYAPETHLNRALIHLVYGVTTAVTTHVLKELTA